MMRIQMEMQKAQAEYVANPTPENMAIMQQKIAALTQESMRISMQGASAAMAETYGQAGAEMYAQAIAGMMTDEDEEADEQIKLDFVKANQVPNDQEKYTLIGALLISTHDEPWQCFASMSDTGYWKEILKDGWDIKDISAGRKMLDSLLEGRHEKRFGDEFRKMKAGQPNKLDEESVEGYTETLEGLKEEVPSLFAPAQKCNTLVAWDLERAGYLARIYFNLGWIDEAELLDWLKKTATAIKAGFSVWEDYFVSILIGRAVAYNFDYFMIGSIYDIFNEGQDILKKYPLSSL